MSNALCVENLSFAYGKRNVLNNISFDILENTIFFLMGNNGSGKTTLMNCILGNLAPSEGNIKVMGKNTKNMTLNELSKEISYVPQNASTNCDFLIKDYLALGRNPYISLGNPKKKDYDIVYKYAQKTGIINLLNRKFNELSGGQKQWCSITRALVQETPIIILDEPMSALDMGKQAELLLLLKELREKEEKTIFLTTHNPNHCTKLESTVCWIHGNKIYSIGSPHEVFTNETVKKIYGKHVNVTETLTVDFEL